MEVKFYSTLRFRMLLYVGGALALAALSYFLLLQTIDNTMMDLMDPRPEAIAFVAGRNISVTFGDNTGSGTAVLDQSKFDQFKQVRSVLPVLLFPLSVAAAVALFYRRHIKRPLEALEKGIAEIQDQNLNFVLESDAQNELGRLCGAFETMRGTLAGTLQSLWRSEENQRSLYRAFAHDLRTPLTVIKGSGEIVAKAAEEENGWQKVRDAVALSQNAAARIERYAAELQLLESIDDRQLELEPVELAGFFALLRRQCELLGQEHGKEIVCSVAGEGVVRLDGDLLQRILDNLLQNALVYAEGRVQLNIKLEGNRLLVVVEDDGPGFAPEALRQATEPFYTTRREQGHTGIGLTVVGRLLEKWGGHMELENRQSGGARVKIILEV